LRDARSDAAADKTSDTPADKGKDQPTDKKSDSPPKNSSDDEQATLIRVTASDVAEAVAGLDESKSKPLAAQVSQWIKTTTDLKDDEFAAQRKTLEADAKKLIGDPHPMRVLNNWLERQVAELLSNPQLPAAVDALIEAKQQAN